jgi:DNA-binding SARP family transcriptional activator
MISGDSSAPTLDLVCFGPPTARIGGSAPNPEVLWRKHLAFLVYLALSPHRTRTRQHLLGLLWPEGEESAGRHSLNEAIRRLRAHLGADRLRSEGDSVALSDAGLTVDALAFDAAAGIQPRRAISFLTGDFLEGFGLSDAPAFDEWVAGERDRYRAKGVALLVGEGAHSLLDGDTTDACELSRRALALEPYSEPSARLLIRAAAFAGDAAGALATYHAFVARLERELREQPSRELRALADRIRHDRWRGVALRHPDSEVPLVRRGPHRAALAVVAEALASGARTLIVSGDPGSGRTRLLAECLDYSALEGAALATARPLETDHDAPWSTLRALMRAGLARAPGVAGTDPAALAVLAALVPELAERATPRVPRDRAEVAASVGALLRSLADETPLVLAIDDAQFADGATIGALHAAISELDPAPILLIITTPGVARSGPPELLTLRASVGGTVPGRAVRLDPLSLEEVRELVRAGATWCTDEAGRDRLARRIAFETAGNVFLAVTLLRALEESAALRQDALAWPAPEATLDSPLPISVPALARMAITARVTRLDEASQRVLATASVVGLAIDPELMASLTGMPQSRVEDLLPPLERLAFVVFDGERYAFVAPLVAQVVRGEFLTPGQQRTLRQRMVGLLAMRTDLESRILRIEFQARVEPGREVLNQAIAVAREALASGARRTATRALAAAERAIGTGDGADAVELDQLRAALRTSSEAADTRP